MENHPSPPREDKKAKKLLKLPITGIALIHEDLLLNIFYRLPAVSFASAACVSKYWNQACNRLLSRPRLSSALSLNPSKQDAVQEVLDKVLCAPLRPHFAIANVDRGFDLATTLQTLVEKLGSKTPIVLSQVNGCIGRDIRTDEYTEYCDISEEDEENAPMNSGILLTVGFVPGLKVDVIPLSQSARTHQVTSTNVDKFVKDIWNFTTFISGCTAPVGIIMFGDLRIDQKAIMEKLDYAMPSQTVIVGNERGHFVFRNGTSTQNVCQSMDCSFGAVALVFARDKNKPQGIGDIQFHVASSNGLSSIGPRYKVVSVKQNSRFTWLTARREGQHAILDGQTMLDGVNNELENHIECPEVLIGVLKQRKYSLGSKKPKLITSLAFHGILDGDEEYLYVEGVGIKTGDYFQFYHSDPKTALSSIGNVFDNLRSLKLEWSCKDFLGVDYKSHKTEALGCFVFACCGRGNSFFGKNNIESSPFLDNFPGVPLAGMFCCGEILRGSTHLTEQEDNQKSYARCSLHVYSTVYLVMTYNSDPGSH